MKIRIGPAILAAAALAPSSAAAGPADLAASDTVVAITATVVGAGGDNRAAASIVATAVGDAFDVKVRICGSVLTGCAEHNATVGAAAFAQLADRSTFEADVPGLGALSVELPTLGSSTGRGTCADASARIAYAIEALTVVESSASGTIGSWSITNPGCGNWARTAQMQVVHG